jgi:hypothetical protein
MGPRQNENAHASAAEDEIFYWAAITERAKRSDEGPRARESDNKGTRAARYKTLLLPTLVSAQNIVILCSERLSLRTACDECEPEISAGTFFL